MRYSDKFLDDSNFDTELELLCEKIGRGIENYDTFTKDIDGSFEKQQHELGFEKYVKGITLPNISGDCRQAFHKGKLAYEFGNGFMIINFEVVL